MMRQRRPVARAFPFSNQRFLEQFESLSKGKQYRVLLESARGGEYSIAGLDPVAIAKGKDGITTIQYKGDIIFKEGIRFSSFLSGLKR